MDVIRFEKDFQYYKFCLYGFLKNLRFFDPFLLLFLLGKLDNNYSAALSLYSVKFIVRAVLEIPSGIIADALGRKGSMLMAYGFYIISFFAYYWADSFVLLLLPTILFGIGDAFRTGTHKAMILEYLKCKGWQNAKADYYGNTRAWSQAGSAISSVLAAILMITTKNYNDVFLATVVPYVIGFMLLASYPSYLDKKGGFSKDLIINIKSSTKTSFQTIKQTKTLILLGNTSFYSGFHNALKDLLQPIIAGSVMLIPYTFFLDKEQKSALLIGIFYFIIYIISSFASKKAGIFSRHFASEFIVINKLAISGIVLALIISVFIMLKLPLVAALLFLPFFPLLSLQRPSSISCISKNVDNAIMATTLSVESQMASVVAALLAFIAGKLIQLFDLGIGLAIISLLGLLVMLFLKLNLPKGSKSMDE